MIRDILQKFINNIPKEPVDIDIQPENIKGISLLSVKEAKELPKDILETGKNWWLWSSGYRSYTATYVNFYGYVDEAGTFIIFGGNFVRPVLYTNLKSSNLKFGNVYKFIDEKWFYIGEGRFLIKDNIGKHRFNNDPYFDDYFDDKLSWEEYQDLCGDAEINNYEKSEIKQYLEDWLRSKLREFG